MSLTSAGVFCLHFHTSEVSSSPQEENTQRDFVSSQQLDNQSFFFPFYFAAQLQVARTMKCKCKLNLMNVM